MLPAACGALASPSDAYLEFFALLTLEHAVRCRWASCDVARLFDFLLRWLRERAGGAAAARSSIEKAVRLTVTIAARSGVLQPVLELAREALWGTGAAGVGAQLLRCLAEDLARAGGRAGAALLASERAALSAAATAALPDMVALLSRALAAALEGGAAPEYDAVAVEAMHAVLALVSWAPLSDAVGAEVVSHIIVWAQRRPVTDASCLALRVLADITAKRFVPAGVVDFVGTVASVTLSMVSGVVAGSAGVDGLPETYLCAMTDFVRDLARVHRDRVFGGANAQELLHLAFKYVLVQPTVRSRRARQRCVCVCVCVCVCACVRVCVCVCVGGGVVTCGHGHGAFRRLGAFWTQLLFSARSRRVLLATRRTRRGLGGASRRLSAPSRRP